MKYLISILLLSLSLNAHAKGSSYIQDEEPNNRYSKPCMIQVNPLLYFDGNKITYIEVSSHDDNIIYIYFGGTYKGIKNPNPALYMSNLVKTIKDCNK